MVFRKKQEQNESYTLKDILLKPELETHEFRSHWKLMKNSEVNKKYKNKYGKLNTILSISDLKRNIFPYGRLMKQ